MKKPFFSGYPIIKDLNKNLSVKIMFFSLSKLQKTYFIGSLPCGKCDDIFNVVN